MFKSLNPYALLAKYSSKIGQSCAIIFFILCAIRQQTLIDLNRGFIADQEQRYEAAIKKLGGRKNKEEVLRAQYMYMPEGNSLSYISLGNPSLAADYVWLTSLQYVSNAFRRGHKFEMLSRFYRTMLDLDPHWISAAINGGKVLSALEDDRYLVEIFYIRAVIENPDDWKLPYEAGRLFVVPPLDPEQLPNYSRRAVAWFKTARSRKSFPSSEQRAVDDLISRLSLESGEAYYEEAADMLRKHATNPDYPQAFREISARDYLNAHSLVIVSKLQQMVDTYQKTQGGFPPSLKPIFTMFPEGGTTYMNDDFGHPIEYDAVTGRVSSRGVNARRAIQVACIIHTLIANFKADHNERVPRDLNELRDDVRKVYKNPAFTLSAAITDAIGMDLDPTRSPIGSWDYDPVRGIIQLPPYCSMDDLYKNVDKIFKK